MTQGNSVSGASKRLRYFLLHMKDITILRDTSGGIHIDVSLSQFFVEAPLDIAITISTGWESDATVSC